jgi:hypothetical protein
MNNKKKEIQKHINFIFKKFDFNKSLREEITNAFNLLKAYEQNKDIEFFDIQDDFTNKKIVIKIKPFNDKEMVYVIEDDGK